MIVYMPEAPILPFIQWRIDELAKPKRMEMNMFDKSLEFIADFTNKIMTYKIMNFEIMPFILYIVIIFYASTFYIDLVYLYIAGIIMMTFCTVRFKSVGATVGILLFLMGSAITVTSRHIIIKNIAETESALESL
jgi:hypothetical protein